MFCLGPKRTIWRPVVPMLHIWGDKPDTNVPQTPRERFILGSSGVGGVLFTASDLLTFWEQSHSTRSSHSISPYPCGPRVICQTSMLPSLPSFFLLTLGSDQAHHSCCSEGSDFHIQCSSSDLQASRQDHLLQAQTPPLQPPCP